MMMIMMMIKIIKDFFFLTMAYKNYNYNFLKCAIQTDLTLHSVSGCVVLQGSGMFCFICFSNEQKHFLKHLNVNISK